MRRRHFEALRPICPVCQRSERESALEIATVVREVADDVLEGVVRCTDGGCLMEYPVIDGIPLFVADLRALVSDSIGQIQARDDLSATLESILGDCCGPGSPFDASRQQLSSYTWDHYGDLDPEENSTNEPRPGSVTALLERALALAADPLAAPVIDVGCSVGRTTFDLARHSSGLTLGIDLNFAMLRTASQALRDGVVRYPRRRVGVVYDRREFEVRLPGVERVDFWACDAAALPFPAGTFGTASCLNVIDCVASPVDTLAALARVLAPDARLLLASPYDWSPGATPVGSWLGGHSQRGGTSGASEPVLRALLTPGGHPASVVGLRIVAEELSVPWRVRMHERSTVEYRVHLLVAEKEQR